MALTMAVPQVIYALRLLALRPALERIAHGASAEELTADKLLVENGLATALTFADAAEPRRRIALAFLRRAERLGRAEAEAQLLAIRGDQLLSQALTRSPADPEAWFFLAVARDFRQAPAGEITQLLVRSGVAGPALSHLALPRLRLTLSYWPFLDQAGRDLARADAAVAFRRSPDDLVKLIQASPSGRALLDSLLPDLRAVLAPRLAGLQP